MTRMLRLSTDEQDDCLDSAHEMRAEEEDVDPLHACAWCLEEALARATKAEAEAFDAKAKLEGAHVLLREAKKAFTLEDLEAQIARTQGRGDGSGVVPKRLLWSLEEEAFEVQQACPGWTSPGSKQASQEALKLELGDLLNVTVAAIMHAGFTLREVVAANDAKMRARMPEGVEQ